MVHFTCDLCGMALAAAPGASRYVVKIAAYAGFDPNQITEDDLDEDHMEAVAQALKDDGPPAPDADESLYKGFRFDLCPACHRKFLKDPLGRDLIRTFDFSEN